MSAVQEEQQQLRARVAGLVAESSVQQVHLQEATELLAQQPRAEEVTRCACNPWPEAQCLAPHTCGTLVWVQEKCGVSRRLP